MHRKEVDEQYNSLKNLHGGLNGTENTGYDDSMMEFYIDKDDGMIQLDQEVHDDYLQLLHDHRIHILTMTMNQE